MNGTVCVVDDDFWVCHSLTALLETYGFTVLTYPSGEAFLADDRRRRSAKCLVIDQQMPGLDGLDVVAALQRDGGCLPTVLITAGKLDKALTERAGALGVRTILEKPFSPAHLLELLDNPGAGSN